MDPQVLSAIASSGQFVGQGFNTLSQAYGNRQQRNFAVKFWNMQNEYNLPINQMQRFKDAGLNPHLIYGQGNAGNASPISLPDRQDPEPGNALKVGSLTYLNSIYDLQMKQAQTENLRAQNAVIKEEVLLKQQQRRNMILGYDTGDFKLTRDKSLADVYADYRREQLRQTRVNTDIAISRDAREAVRMASDLKEAIERMENMKIQRAQSKAEINRILEHTRNLKNDTRLKQLDINLKADGVQPTDALWQRVIAQNLDLSYKGIKSTAKSWYDWLFK